MTMTREEIQNMIDAAVTAATEPCTECRAARARQREHERRAQYDSILALPSDERAAALRGLTHAARIEVLRGAHMGTAIELARELGTEILDALPLGVRRGAEAYTRELVPYYRARTAGKFAGRTAHAEITDEQHHLLTEAGLAPWTRRTPRRDGWLWIGLDLSEGVWLWTDAQLAAILDVDREVADMMADGRISIEPLTEGQSRALMAL